MRATPQPFPQPRSIALFVEARGGGLEGLGLVTLVAWCPVIVSDLPAVRDVVDNPGLRVRPSDHAPLAAAVVAMLDAAPAERSRQAAVLRERLIERFEWSHRARAYGAILAQLAASGESAA